jgi:hypothetical protein
MQHSKEQPLSKRSAVVCYKNDRKIGRKGKNE